MRLLTISVILLAPMLFMLIAACSSEDRTVAKNDTVARDNTCTQDADCLPCGDGCIPASMAPYTECMMAPSAVTCRCVDNACIAQ